jgi:hypothetical protein
MFGLMKRAERRAYLGSYKTIGVMYGVLVEKSGLPNWTATGATEMIFRMRRGLAIRFILSGKSESRLKSAAARNGRPTSTSIPTVTAGDGFG